MFGAIVLMGEMPFDWYLTWPISDNTGLWKFPQSEDMELSIASLSIPPPRHRGWYYWSYDSVIFLEIKLHLPNYHSITKLPMEWDFTTLGSQINSFITDPYLSPL